MQGDKGKFVMHEKFFVSILNGLGDDFVFDKTAIDLIILKITVAPGNLRFSGKARKLHKVIFSLHRQ